MSRPKIGSATTADGSNGTPCCHSRTGGQFRRGSRRRRASRRSRSDERPSAHRGQVREVAGPSTTKALTAGLAPTAPRVPRPALTRPPSAFAAASFRRSIQPLIVPPSPRSTGARAGRRARGCRGGSSQGDDQPEKEQAHLDADAGPEHLVVADALEQIASVQSSRNVPARNRTTRTATPIIVDRVAPHEAANAGLSGTRATPPTSGPSVPGTATSPAGAARSTRPAARATGAAIVPGDTPGARLVVERDRPTPPLGLVGLGIRDPRPGPRPSPAVAGARAPA